MYYSWQFNTSTLQHFNTSTLQTFNPSTLQPFKPSTLQPFHHSLPPFNPSTLPVVKPSTLQPLNSSSLQPFKISTLSTLQPFNPSFLPFKLSTLQTFNPSTAPRPCSLSTLQPPPSPVPLAQLPALLRLHFWAPKPFSVWVEQARTDEFNKLLNTSAVSNRLALHPQFGEDSMDAQQLAMKASYLARKLKLVLTMNSE